MIKTLQLKNFRNYAKASLDFSPKITALVGENAMGKTNILEAIGLFGLLKSFRGVDQKSLIRDGQEASQLILEVDEARLEMLWTREGSGRTLKINGAKTIAKKILQACPLVVFTADDLFYLVSDPARRRRFLDAIAFRLDFTYNAVCLTYQKAVRNRNAVLAQNGDSEQLAYWEDLLTKNGTLIWQKRTEIVTKLNAVLANFTLPFTLDYQTGLEEDYSAKLRANRKKDTIIHQTTFGPHRDDLVLRLGGYDLKSHGSRGEIKSCIFALKHAESLHLEQTLGQSVTLLLDDIFSELDLTKTSLLYDLIGERQTILTAVREPSFVVDQVYEIEAGEIN